MQATAAAQTVRPINADVPKMGSMKLLPLAIVLLAVIGIIASVSFSIYLTSTLDKGSVNCYTGRNVRER